MTAVGVADKVGISHRALVEKLILVLIYASFAFVDRQQEQNKPKKAIISCDGGK